MHTRFGSGREGTFFIPDADWLVATETKHRTACRELADNRSRQPGAAYDGTEPGENRERRLRRDLGSNKNHTGTVSVVCSPRLPASFQLTAPGRLFYVCGSEVATAHVSCKGFSEDTLQES